MTLTDILFDYYLLFFYNISYHEIYSIIFLLMNLKGDIMHYAAITI